MLRPSTFAGLALAVGPFFYFAAPLEPAAGAPPAAAKAPIAVCTESFVKQRACTDTYIPALVDARVALDVPPGIRARGQGPGRAALVAAALEEWKEDSTDGAIAKTCQAMMAQKNAEEPVVTSLSSCLGHQRCADFVPCEIQVISRELASRH